MEESPEKKLSARKEELKAIYSKKLLRVRIFYMLVFAALAAGIGYVTYELSAALTISETARQTAEGQLEHVENSIKRYCAKLDADGAASLPARQEDDGEQNGEGGGLDLFKFWTVWDIIKKNYVFQPVKDSALSDGALRGMVRSLGDKYTEYMAPEEVEEFNRVSDASAVVGIYFVKRGDVLEIVQVLDGAAAKAAGVEVADRILAVDGESVALFSPTAIAKKLRGAKDTVVTLTLLRRGWAEPRDIAVKREFFPKPFYGVAYEMLPDGAAYIRFGYFNKANFSDWSAAAAKIKKKHPRGIILDLRGNPGGKIEVAAAIAGEWLGVEKIVAFLEGGARPREALPAVGLRRFKGLKTIVLVDKNTASAAEIVAAALRSGAGARIMGEWTYGKGTGQEIFYLKDGSALKITTTKWFTPEGDSVNYKGIGPDLVLTDEEMRDPNADAILKAVAADFLLADD